MQREDAAHQRQADARLAAGIEADAAVLDAHQHRAAFHRCGEIDRAARLHVARRVLEERREHLRQARRVGVHHGALARQQHREMMARGVDVGPRRFERHVDRRLQRHALAAQQELAARDALDVQEIIDQARELLDLALDHALAPGHLRIGASGPRNSCARVARNSSFLRSASFAAWISMPVATQPSTRPAASCVGV